MVKLVCKIIEKNTKFIYNKFYMNYLDLTFESEIYTEYGLVNIT